MTSPLTRLRAFQRELERLRGICSIGHCAVAAYQADHEEAMVALASDLGALLDEREAIGTDSDGESLWDAFEIGGPTWRDMPEEHRRLWRLAWPAVERAQGGLLAAHEHSEAALKAARGER